MKSILEFPNLQAAVNSEVALYIPPGNHIVDQPVTCNNKSLSLFGAGEISRFVYTGTGNFLNFNGGQTGRDGHCLVARGFAVQTLNNARTAISAQFTGARTTPHRSVTIENVSIFGTGSCGFDITTKNFRTAVELINASNVRIRGFMADACLSPGSVGIMIASDDVTHATEMTIDDSIIDKFDTGIVFGGYCEGLHLTNSTILSCVAGVNVASAFNGKPGIFIENNHINTRVVGVNIESSSQAFISGNLFYSQFGVGQPAYYCVRIAGGTVGYHLDSEITNNIFENADSATPESYAIIIAGGPSIENVLIDNNKSNRFKFGALLQAGTNNVRVTKTNEWVGAQYPVYDQGSGNIIEV